MATILKESYPVARKEHICDLCGCKINKGQKYYKQTNAYDGSVYDWFEHVECRDVTYELDMFDECDYDEGLTPDYFNDIINDYIHHNHHDDVTDDIAKEWQNLSRYEEVCKILEELSVKSSAD